MMTHWMASRGALLVLSVLVTEGCASSNGTGPIGDSGTSSGSSSGGGSSSSASSSGASSSGASSSGSLATSCGTSGDGLTNCGASTESCCTSLEVVGGTYDRTYVNTGNGATGLADPATITGFRLDKYSVTVGRFRQFVAAWNAGFRPSNGSGKHSYLNAGQGLANSASAGTYESGWSTSDNNFIVPTNSNLACDASTATWTPSPGAQERLPMNCVSWYEAYAFCIWDGGVLPSEAEWEYAGAGGAEQREYPWGSTSPGTGSQYAVWGCQFPSGSPDCTGLANIAPVGSAKLGLGLWGQLDLVGEVAQWTMDWYAPTYADPCVDCAYLAQTPGRVVRGGDFGNGSEIIVPVTRYGTPPLARSSTIGLRCARSP